MRLAIRSSLKLRLPPLFLSGKFDVVLDDDDELMLNVLRCHETC